MHFIVSKYKKETGMMIKEEKEREKRGDIEEAEKNQWTGDDKEFCNYVLFQNCYPLVNISDNHGHHCLFYHQQQC